MASSQTKSKVESSPRFLRNPLKLQEPKAPIVSAEGHVFNGDLLCGRCGQTWSEQRAQPIRCGADPAEPDSAGVDPVGGD